jgi:signal transduction histidine kinase
MLRRLLAVSILFVQVAVTFAILFCIYMLFAVLDSGEANMIHMIGLFFIQPILAIIYSAVSIFACYLVGLPIRLNAIHSWWRSRPIIPIVGVVVGMILLLLSFHGDLSETVKVTLDEEEVTKQIPNTTMILTGWFFVAFFSLHFFPLWRKLV